jgi:hypothetical protein
MTLYTAWRDAFWAELERVMGQCAVCERLEISHANPGRRKQTVPQVEAERAAMIGASAEAEGL